ARAGGTGSTRAASSGGARTGGAGAAEAGGAAGAGGVGGTAEGTGAAGAAGLGGARTRGAGASGAGGAAGAGGAGGAAGARGAGAIGARGAAGAGGATRTAGAGGAGAAGSASRRSFFYPQPQSSLPPPDSVLRQRVVLPEPPASSLPHVPDPESDVSRAAKPTVTRLLATVVIDPDFESTTASSLVTELVDLAARSRLDYVSSLTAMDEEMASWKSTCTYVDVVSPSRAIIADGMWIFKVKRPLGSPPAFKGSLHEEIWLRRPPGFSGLFPAGTKWSLRRSVYGLRHAPREWLDILRTTLAAIGFAPSTTDPSLFLRTDTTLPPFYILVYVDDLVFATANTQALALVKAKLQERHTCTDLGELRIYLGLQITRDRARCTITLTQSHMVHQVLQRFGFQFSSPQPTPLSIGHSLSAPPSDDSVEPSGLHPELGGCLMYLMTCTRHDLVYPLSLLARYVAPDRHRKVHRDAAKRVVHYLCSILGMGLVLGGRGSVVLTGHSDASWADDQATQRSSQGYTFTIGSDSVSWRSTRSSSVLGSSCEAEIYAGAMAAQELRWLTYLLTDLGERPCSPPVLYVDNKAMLALCREQRLEHRTKHIALRYFFARELQQRRQLRLSYVALRANTADVFARALGSGDHQRFCTALGLVPTQPHLLVA
ncbi:unnamed protein product, partial [Closterium sp. NIES-54]